MIINLCDRCKTREESNMTRHKTFKVAPGSYPIYSTDKDREEWSKKNLPIDMSLCAKCSDAYCQLIKIFLN